MFRWSLLLALSSTACGESAAAGSGAGGTSSDASHAAGTAGAGGSSGAAAVDAGEVVLWPISKSPLPDADEIRAQYGPRWISKYDFHAGIDLPAAKGTPVHSILDGKVVNVVPWDGSAAAGNNVLIEHSGARFTAYLHLDSIAVALGDQLAAGELVGGVGDTGATYDHLHLTYMVGLSSPKNDERKSRNPLEVLPHSAPPEPTLTFGSPIVAELSVQQMTVRTITLSNGASSRSVDYYDVVLLGSVARDEHVQFGVYLDAAAASAGSFPLSLGLEPADFVPSRVVLEDFSGNVVLDALK